MTPDEGRQDRAIEMLKVVRAALQQVYDEEYPLDGEAANWHRPARRALLLSKRFLEQASR